MNETIIPLDDRVLIEKEETGNPSSTLYVPPQYREHCMTGTVLKVGSGCKFSLQPGQRVLLGAFTGVKFNAEGRDLLICKEDEIQGVVIGDEPVVAKGA